jgi:1,2-diacylglycerol 3-alpha-glucosyltransferase
MPVGIVTQWNEAGAGYVAHAYVRALGSAERIHIYHRGKISNNGARLDKDTTSSLNIIYHRAASSRANKLSDIDLEDLKKWIDTNNISIILFNEQHFWGPVLFCKSLGLRLGAYVDYYLPNTVPFFQVYDFLICNTKRHYSVFSWHPHCFYIPWGTNLNLFKPQTLDRVDAKKIVFFHSSGLSPYRKGTDLVLHAFETMPYETCRLVIHSQLPEHKYPSKIRKTIKKLKTNGNLDFIEGTVPAPGLYCKGDVYVYPSRLDGIGLTVPEAMACGLPVITTDEPPMNELVQPGCGDLVRVEKYQRRYDNYYWKLAHVSIDDLRSKMYTYIVDPGKVISAKENALRHATAQFNWLSNASNLSELINDDNLRTYLSAALEKDITYFNSYLQIVGRKLRQKLIIHAKGIGPVYR